MSGKAQAGNDIISHESETVRARLAIAFLRRVWSGGLKTDEIMAQFQCRYLRQGR